MGVIFDILFLLSMLSIVVGIILLIVKVIFKKGVSFKKLSVFIASSIVVFIISGIFMPELTVEQKERLAQRKHEKELAKEVIKDEKTRKNDDHKNEENQKKENEKLKAEQEAKEETNRKDEEKTKKANEKLKDETAKKKSKEKTTADKPKKPKKEKKKTEFEIGEEAELDGYVVVVTNVEKSQGDDFDEPKEGNEYIIVTVDIKNNSNKEISYNPFDFTMKNSQGQIVDTGFIIVDHDTSLESGKLAQGGNVSGTIPFEQPKNDKELQLIFEPNFWSEKRLTFNLQ